MKRVPLGKTELNISALCMGTMTFGREADRAASAALFHRSREAGINLFDCADIYAGGEAERLLGELTEGCRDEVILTSKVYFAQGGGLRRAGLSRAHILGAVEASLRRLRTDRLDIYFLHAYDEQVPLEETLQVLADLVGQGKVRYTGVSNFAAWQTMRGLGLSAAHGWPRFACLQPMYSLVKRQAEVELLPMARAEHLGVLTYSPLGGGLLTGKYQETSLVDGRLASNDIYRRRYGQQTTRDAARRFIEFARAGGYHPVTLAVAWVSANPAVTAPILGARDVAQLEPALAAVELNMTPDLYAAVGALTPTPPTATDRNEQTDG